MKNAIVAIFPKADIVFVLGISRKSLERIYLTFTIKKSMFKHDVKKLIHTTYALEEFEELWKRMMITYDLENNLWLCRLYEIRESWVHVFNCGTYFAGMNTTGRSEGRNAFFDDFVSLTTNLREFIDKYEQTLKNIVKRESGVDFDDDEYLLKHVAKIYMRKIFNSSKMNWLNVIYIN